MAPCATSSKAAAAFPLGTHRESAHTIQPCSALEQQHQRPPPAPRAVTVQGCWGQCTHRLCIPPGTGKEAQLIQYPALGPPGCSSTQQRDTAHPHTSPWCLPSVAGPDTSLSFSGPYRASLASTEGLTHQNGSHSLQSSPDLVPPVASSKIRCVQPRPRAAPAVTPRALALLAG